MHYHDTHTSSFFRSSPNLMAASVTLRCSALALDKSWRSLFSEVASSYTEDSELHHHCEKKTTRKVNSKTYSESSTLALGGVLSKKAPSVNRMYICTFRSHASRHVSIVWITMSYTLMTQTSMYDPYLTFPPVHHCFLPIVISFHPSLPYLLRCILCACQFVDSILP